MSTIAICNKMIAADSLIVADNHKTIAAYPKILFSRNGVWAYVGELSVSLHVLQVHVKCGTPLPDLIQQMDKDIEFEIIKVTEMNDGCVRGMHWSNEEPFGTHWQGPMAFGSGCQFALGHLFLKNASAAGAISAAGYYDVYTGGPTQACLFEDIESLIKNVEEKKLVTRYGEEVPRTR